MKLRLALTLIAGALFFSCAAAPPQNPRVGDLEREIQNRRSSGAVELSRRIESLVETNDLGDIRAANPRLALAATGGRLKVASAAWWGWKADDSTWALNAALASPVDVLIVPAMSGPWIVGPLFLKGPRTVIFENGSVVLAKKGAFRSRVDCLLTIERKSGIKVSGYGATLRMRKSDYTAEPYSAGQWRHALSIKESERVLIEGLSIDNSGGDGVYIGQGRNGTVPRDITLRDLELSGHHRQGVSVIAAERFLMEYCLVTGTRGTAPQAGIDFEPNTDVFGLVDCRVSHSVFRNNSGAAVHVHLKKMDPSQPPVSILVEDSALLGAPLAIWARGFPAGVRGTVDFADCVIDGIKAIKRSEGVFTVIR